MWEVASIALGFVKWWVYPWYLQRDEYIPGNRWSTYMSRNEMQCQVIGICERDGHAPEMREITSGVWGYLHFSMVISYQIRTYPENLCSLVYISLWLLFDISNTSCEFASLYLVCFACLIFFASMFIFMREVRNKYQCHSTFPKNPSNSTLC